MTLPASNVAANLTAMQQFGAGIRKTRRRRHRRAAPLRGPVRRMAEFDILLRMGSALVAGALIGLERTYRGRAAGLRTYALVALGSALLVAATEYAGPWAAPGTGDPTRVIQGIVTGIGFLGAGVIVKEGFTVRGLTTAASIWVVAAIGVAFGAGLYIPGALATFVTWAALDLLHRLEGRVPVQSLVHCEIGFPRSAGLRRRPAARARRAIRLRDRRVLLPAGCGAAQTLEYDLVMRSARADGMPRSCADCWRNRASRASGSFRGATEAFANHRRFATTAAIARGSALLRDNQPPPFRPCTAAVRRPLGALMQTRPSAPC